MANEITPPKSFSESASKLQELDIYRCYKNSKYLSIKYSSYFQVYEELLSKYRGKKIVFVEIGVFNGGSLFMWRDYFGPEARIIGIDFNPEAKKWAKDGFEIHIGNQADAGFWDDFFSTVGDVDIILDDGGHTNEQQIITAHKSIPHVKDGGVLIVEAAHTSYFKYFGNPSRFSFMSYAKKLVDSINSRFPSVSASMNPLKEVVYSLGFYESIVCFHVDRKKCFASASTSNGGVSSNAQDFRFRESGPDLWISNMRNSFSERFAFLEKNSFFQNLSRKFFDSLLILSAKFRSHKLKKYFS
jgi:hypothetical protein